MAILFHNALIGRLSGFDLSEVQNGNDGHSAADVTGRGQHQPHEISRERYGDPPKTADMISPVLAMQCAKWPMPTTKVSNQMTANWPIVQ